MKSQRTPSHLLAAVGRRGKGVHTAGGGVLLLCALLVAACGASTSQATSPTITPPTATASATPTPLPSAGTVSATITGLGANTQVDNGLAASDTAIWVHNGLAGTLVRIDPRTNTIVATIPVGHGEGGVALGEGAVWVANPQEGTVSRIDPQTDRVVATITLAPQHAVQALTVSPGAVWVSQFEQDALVRIDPHANHVVATIPNQPGITGVSFGAGSVWTCSHHNPFNGLEQLNPQTNQVQAQLSVGGGDGRSCSAVVALAAQTVWATSHINGEHDTGLQRIDPVTKTVVATIPVPQAIPFHFAANEQGVWLYSESGVYRVDPATNQLVGQLAIPDVFGIAVAAGAVWVSKGDGTLLRITPAS